MNKDVLCAVLLAALGLMTTSSSAQAQMKKASHQRSTVSQTFESKFWSYLLSNNYKNWAPPAGQGGGFVTGKSPHGQLYKLYLNRTAASDPDSLNDESVIVMENYKANKTLESISVMLRSAGSSPTQKDWYWITYGPDGSVIGSNEQNNSDGPIQLRPDSSFVNASSSMGVGSSCTQCHQAAPGDDFVFFNDKNPLSVATRPATESSR